MVALRGNSRLIVVLLFSVGQVRAQSEQTNRTVRHHPVAVPETSVASTLLDQAENLLAK